MRHEGPSALVIGGGMAGMTCAHALMTHGMRVEVVDKGRSLGGRMSTRRRDGFAFDHGAQYFTARTPDFRRCVESWRANGWVTLWSGRAGDWDGNTVHPEAIDEARYVGSPGMGGPLASLAGRLPVHSALRISELERRRGSWEARAESGERLRADIVLVAVPAPQAAELLAPVPDLAKSASGARLDPCWAAMLGFTRELPLPFDAIRCRDSVLAWAARDSSKPDRHGGESWVLHAGSEWSSRHLEQARAQASEALSAAFRPLLGPAAPEPVHLEAHRWRYARVAQPLGVSCLYDAGARIGACGDWCVGARVEAAFLSGSALAQRVLGAETPAAIG